MKSYKPEELFDENGSLVPELKELNPVGPRRMGSKPHANGGLLRRALNLPAFQDYAIEMDRPGSVEFEKHQGPGHLHAGHHGEEPQQLPPDGTG